MKRGNVYSLNNSYLKVVEAGAQESDLAIYKIEDNKLAPVKELVCKNTSIALIEILPNQILAFKKVLPDLINKIEYKGRLHIIITTLSSKFGFISIFSYLLIKRYLKQLKWVNIEAFGLIPDGHSPQIIMPFKGNIYQYVVSDFYRGRDNALKHFVKKFIIILLGQFVWKGSIALIVKKENKLLPPEKATDLESWLDNERSQDKLCFITGDKNIILIFKKGGKKPEAVLKYGKLADIEKEYISHSKAQALFPGLVPEIRFFKSEGDIGKLCMEYVDGVLLINIIGSVWIGRKRRYLQETRKAFQLFIDLLKLFPFEERKAEDSYSYRTVRKEDILSYFGEKNVVERVRRVIEEGGQINSPLLMQHRDFCLRNILYEGMERKVIIDWEDCEENDLPLVDFNMLLISVIRTYNHIFKEEKKGLINSVDMLNMVGEMKDEVRRYLRLEPEDFWKLSVLSTLSLWSQNMRKGRRKTSEDIFSFLVAELLQEFK